MRELSCIDKKNGTSDKLLFFLRTCVFTSKLKNISHARIVRDLGCGYNGNFPSNINLHFFKLQKAVDLDLSVNQEYFSRKELRSLFTKLGYKEIHVTPFQFRLNTIAVCRK